MELIFFLINTVSLRTIIILNILRRIEKKIRVGFLRYISYEDILVTCCVFRLR